MMGQRAVSRRWTGIRTDDRASVSVEMALVTTFFLIPLLLFGLDFMFLVLGRQQLAEASRAVMMFAWSNPGSATDTSALNTLLDVARQGDVGTIALAGAPAESFACLQADGSETAASGSGCTSGIAETFVTYSLAVTISLPIGFGLIPDPYVISASPTVRTQ